MNMLYLNNKLNGFNTRNKVIRSMDITHAPTYEIALENYMNTWFSSTKKEYLTQAIKLIITQSKLFWPKRAITEMLDEIYINNTTYDDKEMARDIDLLKSKVLSWGTNHKVRQFTDDDILRAVKVFEKKYKYECPDSFKFYWLNNGAYITLMYAVKYENIKLDGMTEQQMLDAFKVKALSIINEHDHDIDDSLLQLVYYMYKPVLAQIK